jgi:UDP-3-O-[3-hydroxymyristoyl] glucosamine N-acyltransferase
MPKSPASEAQDPTLQLMPNQLAEALIGGNANFAGHLTIADRTTISGGTAVIGSILEPGTHLTGVFPSMPHALWEKNAAILRGLDKIRQRIRDLEKKDPKS